MVLNKLLNNIEDENVRKRLALYTRVSTIEQSEEGYSIDEQERLLMSWAEKNNYEVYKCY